MQSAALVPNFIGKIFKSAALFLTIILSLLILSTNISFAQANNLQNQHAINPVLNANLKPGVPVTLHSWTQALMIELMSTVSCQLAGVDPNSPTRQCLGVDPKTGQIGYVSGGGVVNGLGKMIGYLYTPPITGVEYVNYLAQNFGFPKPTYAQATGTGFMQLSPLLTLWGAFRNISYLLFVLVFVVVGIAIMLRVRIDPRTVMSIQNQIPKLVIGIVMVTFSFAIAGFLVDMMWVSTYVAVNVIGSTDTVKQFNSNDVISRINEPPPQFANDFLNTGDIAGGLHDVSSKVSNGVTNVITGMWGQNYVPSSGTTTARQDCSNAGGLPGIGWITCQVNNTMGNIGDFLAGVVGSFFGFIGGLIAGLISAVLGFVAFLIIMIALIVALFRLWFALIKAYIFVLVDVIFAPFWIVAGLLPGVSSMGFSNWIRDLLGNLAAFPAVVAMFALARVFIDAFSTGGGTINTFGFVPPLIGNFQATSSASNVIDALIAFGMILAMPDAVKAVKKAFKAPNNGVNLTGIGAGMAAAGIVGGAVGSRMYRRDPRTGQPTGLAVNVGRNVNRAVTQNRAAGFVKRRVTGVATAVNQNPVTGRIARVAGAPIRLARDNRTLAEREQSAQYVRIAGGPQSGGGQAPGGTSGPGTAGGQGPSGSTGGTGSSGPAGGTGGSPGPTSP